MCSQSLTKKVSSRGITDQLRFLATKAALPASVSLSSFGISMMRGAELPFSETIMHAIGRKLLSSFTSDLKFYSQKLTVRSAFLIHSA